MEPKSEGIEGFVREALEGAAKAFGLGYTVELKPRPGARPVLRATLHPPAGSALVLRRWALVASSLQALVEAALSLRGETEMPVEVGLVELPTAHAAGEVAPDDALVRAARTVAQKAVQLGRPFALGPMSAVERRLVHQALGDVPQVWTQSEGDGIFRRLWVVPRPMMPGRTTTEPSAKPAEGAPPSSGSPPHDPRP